MLKAIATTVFMLSIAACTTPYQVESVDTKLDVKGSTADAKIGINDDGQAIVQREQHADVELQAQQLANYNLRERLQWALNDIQSCREEIAQSAPGGGTVVDAVPELDSIQTQLATEELGVNDEGELKLVTKELYVERLKAERQRGAKLEALLKVAKKHDDQCQRELRVAKNRRDSGIPAH